VAQHGAENATKFHEKTIEKPNPRGVPHRLWATGRWGTLGSRAKTSEKNPPQQKKGKDKLAPHHFSRKSGQHRSKLDPKMEPKSIKNRSKNRSKNRCFLGSIFKWIFEVFGKENGAKLAPKSEPTWCSLKIPKKPCGASPLAPMKVCRVQVGNKNLLKIDQKMRSRWESILTPIFLRFC